MFKPQSVSQPHVLKTIAVLPEGGQMPIFNGNGDINDFLRWVMTNINILKGLEDKPARVVINFTVQKDGTLGLFKVLEAPKEKAYEQTVIELLKRKPSLEACPTLRWRGSQHGVYLACRFSLPK